VVRACVALHRAEIRDFPLKLLPKLTSGGLAVVGFIVNLVLVPLVLFYFLRDWDGIIDGIDRMIPRRHHDRVTLIAREVDEVLGQFLRGQLLVMLGMALFYTVGLWLVGLDYALSVGIFAGLVTFVPYLGVIVGVVLATLVTFPLTFGWIRFEARPRTTDGYTSYVAGVETGSFDATSVFGWLVFHVLDIAAVLVIAGAGWFLWRRFRDREVAVVQGLGSDLVPLVALITVSVTGLLLTFSSLALDGRYYDFLAILHMASVVLTLLYIPFGKFFHVVQRPASVGVQVAKAAALARDGPARCRRCGAPFETAEFVADLQATMGELGLGFAEWADTCPRCKRVARGRAYLRQVKGGFR